MIETAKQQERAILVGVELQETEHFDMSMEELASLAKTAGAEVVASYTQKRERYDSKSFVGSGKLEEIKAMVDSGAIRSGRTGQMGIFPAYPGSRQGVL